MFSFVGAQGGEDGVRQSSAQQPDGLGRRLPGGLESGNVVLARADATIWVTAIMCSAVLIVRLPPRFSRTLPLLLPDHTGMGAVPVNRA